MRKYIWLIRHGESQGNLERRIQGWFDYPLTDLGRQQAAQLAERLARTVCALGSKREHPQRGSQDDWRECPIQEVVASPLRRAAETAHIIGDALGLPVRFDARLREYNFGPLSGLTASEITARFPSVRAAWQANRLWQPLPGEEGEPAFVARVRTAMDEVVGLMAENTSLIVVAHGGSLDACLRSWLGLTHYDDHESPYLYGTSGNGYGRRTFAFDNTSLSLVRVQMHSYRILLLNDICHLRVAQRGREE